MNFAFRTVQNALGCAVDACEVFLNAAERWEDALGERESSAEDTMTPTQKRSLLHVYTDKIPPLLALMEELIARGSCTEEECEHLLRETGQLREELSIVPVLLVGEDSSDEALLLGDAWKKMSDALEYAETACKAYADAFAFVQKPASCSYMTYGGSAPRAQSSMPREENRSAAVPPTAAKEEPFAPPAAQPSAQPSAPPTVPPTAPPKKGLLDFLKGKKKQNAQSDAVLPPQVDSVRFSAVACDRAVPGRYLPVNILMYTDAFRSTVDELLQKHGSRAKSTDSGYRDVERDSMIRVVLTSPDLPIDDGEEERVWNGKCVDFSFAIRIPQPFAQEQILLCAAVYVNGVIATRLKLIVDRDGLPDREIPVERTDIRSAFVSYASQDRHRVAAIVQGMQKARPDMDIFFDIESLRSGQRWEEALRTEIAGRDVLYLCWSKYARESKWVDMEWRFALESKGEDAIEPIPIDSPDVCPPPAELVQKHFHDRMLFIIQATAPVQSRTGVYLLQCRTDAHFALDKPTVVIGKDGDKADIVIADNKAVSRVHASILTRDGRYFVVDHRSTNRTYVDGKPIDAEVEIPIAIGTTIRLGNEELILTE